MEKSRNVDEDDSRNGREISGDASVLNRPLLAEFKTARTRSATVNSKPEQGFLSKISRGRSAPTLDLPNAENLKPPFRGEGHYTILFKAVSVIAIYFAVGIVASYIAGNQLSGSKTSSSLIDAIYFCVVTLTTVGYGDLVPGNTAGKLFTCAYVFLGFGLVGTLISAAANYIVEKQEKILVSAIKTKEPVRNLEFEQAEADDLEATNWKAVVSGILVLLLFIVGIVFLVIFEKLDFIDALYCVCVTVTTLGYGDHSFRTASGRLFAAIWILTSTVCVAQFFLYLAERRTEQRQLKLARWVLHRRTTNGDLEAADLNDDGAVSAPEFVIFKLKELGKIDEEDLVGILREFQKLDYDQSGSISIGDLRLAQPS